MIKLTKLDEPKVLSDNYQSWTDALILHQKKEVIANKKIPSYVKSKYSHPEIKNQLKKETFKKCAYCESKILANSFGDIEHIIPKTFETSMWFCWNNLTLGCQICNNNKSDYFDASDPILDPYADNIDEHIFFAGDILIPKTNKGILTIKILKLNRAELVEARSWHLRKTIDPFIQVLIKESNLELKKEVYNDLLEFTKEFNEFSKMSNTVISQFSSSEYAS
ncbi:HNH endonuclease domain-containing protein [Exiguobacterium marinum]|uniref:HNH endonuclease domain-containing protein n=1 Tax=Exiguobacterium marinum TaxID=273528 RepID=A0ABY7WUW7_9BACL|nr:HNH endonuclease [Exiguobacterium marinum]WDH74678.1 HNH endonuclease domain-containing protein [Exiguobacterium marinum]